MAVRALCTMLPALLLAAGAAHGAPAVGDAVPGVQGALADLRGPLSAPTLPPFVSSAAALLLSCAVAGVLCRRRGSRPAEADAAPAVVSHLALLEDLAADLRDGGLSAERFCQGIAELVRCAVAAAGGIPAECLTTEELLGERALREMVGDEGVAVACQILTLCDRVKFAGHAPSDAELASLLGMARQLLETVPEARHDVS